MLLRTQDPVENIALEGFMFWELMADQKICIHVLAPYLTRLIPILISGMRYSKIEIISLQVNPYKYLFLNLSFQF